MRQLTPQSWGRVYWSGGAGNRGGMGGWRFHCNWCNEGDLLKAIARKPLADRMLGMHVMDKHSNKTEVRVLMNSIIAAGGLAALQNTTGAAEIEAPVDKEQESSS